MQTLYIFNPDHDLALASDSDHFDAPQSAKIFARDFSALPLWYCSENSIVYGEEMIDIQWLSYLQKIFPQLKTCSYTNQILATSLHYELPPQQNFVNISPWGWNKTIRRYFEKRGVSQLPTIEQINKLRTLQHRRLAIEATTSLQTLESPTFRLAKPAQLITADDVKDFVTANHYSIFKAPWSGSGKGIVRSLGYLPENLLSRVKNIAKKQGSVVAETLYTVSQNFAMEFSCRNGETEFVGYSWFFTNEHGTYKGNLLAPNEIIVSKLQRWISEENLKALQNGLTSFITEHIAPNYSGFVGVDMFIFEQDGKIFVHPCVEFNLRMTMGLVARLFYDTFVEKGKTGMFSVDFFNKSEDLFEDHKKKSSKMIHIINGKIQKGYLSLTPVAGNTHYRARVEITS